ncbi:hypothetical protein ACLMJK_001629 [Lecanora helva]
MTSIVDDDDDEELKLAISLSLQEHEAREIVNLDSDEENAPTKHNYQNTIPNSQCNFLGIDRKKMEQERLARKRKASEPDSPSRKVHKICSPPESKQPLQSSQAYSSEISEVSATEKPSGDGTAGDFLKAAVKKTWAFGHARDGNDIKLEEVLKRNDLQLAVLSSFQWDIGWLLAKINTTKTQITLAMQAKDQAIKDQYRSETADMQNLRLCFPSMEGQVNCMHSKLMLLSYPQYLRVVVPTANLVPYDWGESGDMENGVFLVDLPRQPPGKRTEIHHLTEFGKELVYFCKAMGLESSIVESISNFDFTNTKNLAFVHTIGGAHIGESWRRTGYCGLGKAVQQVGLKTDAALEMGFVTSSVGSLTVDFLTVLYLAAQGDDGTKEYYWRNPHPSKSKSRKPKTDMKQVEDSQQRTKDEVLNNFRIYFPTHDTVKASTAGYAGTICFQPKWYNSPTFPRQVMRDCRSIRTGLLMHNKIIYVRSKEIYPGDIEADHKAWAYIGSANCSESAWGKLTKDRATKAPKLNCRNWECGVLFPVPASGTDKGGIDLGVFRGSVPVPMQYPGQPYGDSKPWYYSEQ